MSVAKDASESNHMEDPLCLAHGCAFAVAEQNHLIVPPWIRKHLYSIFVCLLRSIHNKPPVCVLHKICGGVAPKGDCSTLIALCANVTFTPTSPAN
jgi:hypothetical protein